MKGISATTGVTIVNTALILTAGALCWKLKRMAPALMLLFMMQTKSTPAVTVETKEEVDNV